MTFQSSERSARDGFEPSQCTVAYVVFNDGWDLAVDNRRGFTGERLRVEERTHAVTRYLEYLVGSLASLRVTHGSDAEVEVLLVEISKEGLGAEEVRTFIGRRLGGWKPEVVTIARDVVQPFIEEVMAAPAWVHRSPNRMHEFLLVDAIRTSRRRYLALVDTDVVFLASDALWIIGAALAARPEAWIASCLEESLDKAWNGQRLRTRRRMHSVLLVADTEAFRAGFPFAPFLRASALHERLSVIEDPDVRAHYERSGVLDTLSLVTDWLGDRRILDLQTVAGGYREGSMLTIVSQLWIHAKYLERSAAAGVLDTLDSCPATLREHPAVREVVRRCRLVRVES